MPRLTVDNVKTLYPVSGIGQISDALIQSYIDLILPIIDEDLQNIFPETFVAVTEGDLQNYDTKNSWGSNFVSIGAWQGAGLSIKRTRSENENEATLTEEVLTMGKDWKPWFGKSGRRIPGLMQPITSVKLTIPLSRGEILRVYGDYGWQEGYPGIIKKAICQIIMELAGYANNLSNTLDSGSSEAVNKIKSLTVEKTLSPQMALALREEAKNLLSNPTYQEAKAEYLYFIEEGIVLI